jgi:hypothetical protein
VGCEGFGAGGVAGAGSGMGAGMDADLGADLGATRFFDFLTGARLAFAFFIPFFLRAGAARFAFFIDCFDFFAFFAFDFRVLFAMIVLPISSNSCLREPCPSLVTAT